MKDEAIYLYKLYEVGLSCPECMDTHTLAPDIIIDRHYHEIIASTTLQIKKSNREHL